MSNKYIILELLKVDKLTIKEIADKTKFNENAVRTYVHRLLKDNLINQIGKKNRYCLYEAIENDPIEFLKQLYDFMGNYMVIRKDKKEEAKQKRDLIVKIKEMITKCQTY